MDIYICKLTFSALIWELTEATRTIISVVLVAVELQIANYKMKNEFLIRFFLIE